MNSSIFNTRPECEAALRRALSIGGEANLETILLQAYTDSCEERPQRPELRLELVLGRWVIREDDLELFKITRDALVTLASGSFVFKELSTAAITSLAMALISLGRNAVRGGAWLSPDQILVLAAIKAARVPLSVPEISGKLDNANKEVSARRWTRRRTMSVLRSLTEVTTKKNIVALVCPVNVGGTEKWHVQGA